MKKKQPKLKRRGRAHRKDKTQKTASQVFYRLPIREQEKLLDFIQGVRGLKITYDAFFKHVMNPDAHPERLESVLSAVLEQEVSVYRVLPLEGVRMADSGSFVIMDIAVELDGGAMVNVEIQKIGYLFPGERASCYLSDFVMHQYNRVRDERKERFSFRDLKPVILIVIMEDSPSPFLEVFPQYIHRERITYDSGAKVRSLFQTIYISLDTFHKAGHNINTKLEAWLEFLSTDNPADIVRLAGAYPEFLPCYRDIVEFRKNPKELIYMYSEALAVLDRNTENYMCEELKKENEQLRSAVSQKDTDLRKKNAALAEKDAEIAYLQQQQHQFRNQK